MGVIVAVREQINTLQKISTGRLYISVVGSGYRNLMSFDLTKPVPRTELTNKTNGIRKRKPFYHFSIIVFQSFIMNSVFLILLLFFFVCRKF